ncbi:MAG TPA: AraC family transcriptional regulator [Ohtaekwangia sp.]|nr:AraC family transcriptional regulator [Ohtaekwangia sp.]
MLNIYDYIANSKYFKTFKVNDLLVVEYKCKLGEEPIAFWTHCSYFAYILSGVTKYLDGKNECVVRSGEALFIRKGAYVAQQHDPSNYCALVFFVTDEFIEKVANKYMAIRQPTANATVEKNDSIFPLTLDESLSTYFHSVLSYFAKDTAPSDELLKVKVEELFLNIFTGVSNRSLACCLRSIRGNGKVSLRDVMEKSFMYPMSLEEYAKLCARSLSTFKADFYEIYQTSPGKWLIRARLQYAKILIETTGDSVNDIAFKSGFKNTAHFVKVFKDAYGVPPLQYRLKEALAR